LQVQGREVDIARRIFPSPVLVFAGCMASVLLASYVTLRLTAPRHRITKENIDARSDPTFQLDQFQNDIARAV
jgi:hypothetical protein